MERKEVYELIDGEREYQNTVRKENEQETREDEEKSVADFILYMENKLAEAKHHIYYLSNEAAMDSIRKVTGLGVAAMEAFGANPR